MYRPAPGSFRVVPILATVVLLGGCRDDLPSSVDESEPPAPRLGTPLLAEAPWAGGAILVSPTGLDFGDVPVGATAPAQEVTVTNVGSVPVVMSGSGGAAGVFGGSQDCQGSTLAVGASCRMFYAFAPTTAGDQTVTTSGTWNGEPFEIELRGRGVGPRFRISGTAFDFGNVPVGTSVEQEVTVTNIGLAPVTVSMTGGAAGVFGGSQNCQGSTLAVGASCRIVYTFAPTAGGVVTGSTSGTVNGQPFDFTFRGTGVPPSFRITPTAIDFGEVVVGSSLQQAVTVTNTSIVPVTVSMTGGAAGGFGGAQNCQGNTLAPGASCQIAYTFQPGATGLVTGSTSGTVNGQPFDFAFRGTGIASEGARTLQFRIAHTALDFGNVQAGQSVQQQVDVVNVGTSPVTISMTGGAAGVFGGAQNCQGNTLAAGASCQIVYTFAPTEAGVVTGSTSGTVNGQPFAFTFQGTAMTPWFRLSPTAIDFGALPVGESLQQAVTVTNVGPAPAVISMSGGAAGAFGGAQDCQGNTLAVGASCRIVYTFAPSAPGVATGSTSGTINGQPFDLAFRGEGLGARFRITPFAWDFGPQVLGTTTQRTVSVTNVGVAAATISMTGGAAGAFGGAQNCQGNTLAVGAGCELVHVLAHGAGARQRGDERHGERAGVRLHDVRHRHRGDVHLPRVQRGHRAAGRPHRRNDAAGPLRVR